MYAHRVYANLYTNIWKSKPTNPSHEVVLRQKRREAVNADPRLRSSFKQNLCLGQYCVYSAYYNNSFCVTMLIDIKHSPTISLKLCFTKR